MCTVVSCNRARRRRGRQASDVRLAKGHNDGMSTDDEVNNSDVARYKVERGQYEVERGQYKVEQGRYGSKLYLGSLKD